MERSWKGPKLCFSDIFWLRSLLRLEKSSKDVELVILWHRCHCEWGGWVQSLKYYASWDLHNKNFKNLEIWANRESRRKQWLLDKQKRSLILILTYQNVICVNRKDQKEEKFIPEIQLGKPSLVKHSELSKGEDIAFSGLMGSFPYWIRNNFLWNIAFKLFAYFFFFNITVTF